jgi:hypothetical protein
MPITNPDWIPPIEMTFDVGKPIRSEQGVQIAGNPIAIAQGADGAPRVRGNSFELRAIASFSGTGTFSEIEFLSLPASRFFIAEWEVLTASGNFIEAAVSADDGSTYSAWFNVGFFLSGGPDVISQFGSYSNNLLFSSLDGAGVFAGPYNAVKFRATNDGSPVNIAGVTNLRLHNTIRSVVA